MQTDLDHSTVNDIRPSIIELTKRIDSSALQCDKCEKTFRHDAARQFHIVKTHRTIASDADYRLFHRITNTKGKCAASMPTSNNHIGDIIRRRFYCPIIDCRYNSAKHFDQLRLLHQHYHKVHMPKTLNCSHCNEARFSLRRDLVYHEKRCPCRPVPSAPVIAIPTSEAKRSTNANILRRSTTKPRTIVNPSSSSIVVYRKLEKNTVSQPRRIAPKPSGTMLSFGVQCSISARSIDTQTTIADDELIDRQQYFDVSSQAGCSSLNVLPQDFFSQTEPASMIATRAMFVHSGTQMAGDDLDEIFRIVQQTQTDHQASMVDRPIIDRITQTDFDLMRYLHDDDSVNTVDDAFLNI